MMTVSARPPAVRNAVRGLLLIAAGALAILLLVSRPPALAQQEISPELQDIFNKLKAAAEQGNREAQYKLGLLYIGANGFPANYAKARAWFGKAREQGSANAIFNLGLLAEQGLGQDKNLPLALRMYAEAAEQGVPPAGVKVWRLIGQISAPESDSDSADGEGIKQAVTVGQAFGFLEMAAEADVVSAIALLGEEYMRGEHVEKDLAQAVKHLKHAAEQGDAGSVRMLGWLLLQDDAGDLIEPQEVASMLQAVADEGDAIAQIRLGDIHEQGLLGGRNLEEAIKWYEKAAKRGNSQAKGRLGFLYAQEGSTHYDPRKAEKLLVEASKSGDREAQYAAFRTFYKDGKGTDYKSRRQALLWLKSAAKKNLGEAQIQLAQFFLEGNLVPKSPKEAYIWSTVAESNGVAGAKKVQQQAIEAMSPIQVAEANSEAEFRIRQITTAEEQDDVPKS